MPELGRTPHMLKMSTTTVYILPCHPVVFVLEIKDRPIDPASSSSFFVVSTLPLFSPLVTTSNKRELDIRFCKNKTNYSNCWNLLFTNLV